MPTKSEIFVREFVLGFGFLGGLFTWVGVDPEEEVIRLAEAGFDRFDEIDGQKLYRKRK